ncbi:MAG TPA: aldo/keto reductase [Vicinamibacterales bacterium]|jgi:aryl-alcohol dehydrogenase-like predicted oxidoreductase|nr:aldo/keto reductase [Vicinamibacterales bacterium]
MHTRKLGPFDVSALGFGCMSLSHAYGTPPPPETAAAVLHEALDAGYTHVDTAALYGFGANETLIGKTLAGRRKEFVLASKCGMFRNAQGQREIDGRPEAILRTCDDSLSRLETDVIDLYYLHRWDKKVPVEESIGALARLVEAGKVRAIGMSEVSAPTIRRAHAVHPIAAVQTEYSLWTRNAEVAVLDTCRELGIAFVAFSPLARGFLTGELRDVSGLPPKDIRLAMPRFQAGHFEKNLQLLDGFAAVAREQGCTMGQLALAWLLARAPHIIPIPGTTRIDHLRENLGALALTLAPSTVVKLDGLINPRTVSGPRYNAATLPEIDTEDV